MLPCLWQYLSLPVVSTWYASCLSRPLAYAVCRMLPGACLIEHAISDGGISDDDAISDEALSSALHQTASGGRHSPLAVTAINTWSRHAAMHARHTLSLSIRTRRLSIPLCRDVYRMTSVIDYFKDLCFKCGHAHRNRLLQARSQQDSCRHLNCVIR
jgi:hypothetical protein